MSADSYPEKYWHCYVLRPGEKKNSRSGIANDLTFEQLRTEIVEPWRSGKPFAVAGMVVKDRNAISEIRVAHTPEPMKRYSDEHYARMRASGVTDLATDPRHLPFTNGRDFTNELLFSSLDADAPPPDIALVLQLCERLPLAARVLEIRRAGKPPYQIQDEYDVQDLLHAVIRAYIKNSITEEPLGKVGGARSSRADIAVEELGVIIEVKFVRSPKDQARIVDEFAQDLLLYSAWQPLKTFVYFVYNSRDLRDPEALQKLQGSTELNGKKYGTYVILA